MARFVLKTTIFLLPVILVHLYTYLFYNTSGGDLLRVGYIHDGYPQTQLLKEPATQPGFNFAKVSRVGLRGAYDVLTIGDSFSELDSSGYQNYLGKGNKVRILHMDQKIHGNDPFQVLSGLLQADFFDSIQVRYVVLESVERLFCVRALRLDTSKVITYADLCRKIEQSKNPGPDQSSYKFFSNRVLKFTWYNFLYLFADNAVYSDVYQVELNQVLFSNNKHKLLFVYDDLDGTEINNQLSNVTACNDALNRFSRLLKAKNIQLLVLVAADKYDFYYPHIKDKKSYTKPVFFDHIRSVEKEYAFIDSKYILQQSADSRKDIYQYGDTHWSPESSRILASALYDTLKGLDEKEPKTSFVPGSGL